MPNKQGLQIDKQTQFNPSTSDKNNQTKAKSLKSVKI